MEESPIHDWIAQAHAAGLSDAQITEQLLAQGWQPEQVAQLLMPATPPPAPPSHASQAEIAAAMSGGRFGKATEMIPAYTPNAPHSQAPTLTEPLAPSATLTQATPSTQATPAQITQTVFAAKLPGPIALFRATFANYATRFGYYLGYGTIAAVLTVGITIGLVWLLLYFVFTNTVGFGFSPSSDNIIVYIAIVIAVYFGQILLNTAIASWLWSAIGLTVMVPNGQRNFFGIFREAFKRIRHIIWANLIVGYILVGFSILAIVVIFAGSAAGMYFSLYDLPEFLFPLLGISLFLVMVVWIGTYLVYTPFIALIGNGRGIGAVRESQTIVHGLWWHTFGRLAAIAAPILGFTLIVQIILMVLGVNSIIPTIILLFIDIAFFLPICITYMLGMYNTAAQYRQQAEPASRTSTASMLIAATLGWLIVVGAFAWSLFSYRSYVAPYETPPFDSFQDINLPGNTNQNRAPLIGDDVTINVNTNTSATVDDQRRQDVKDLKAALDAYASAHNGFPGSLVSLTASFPNGVPTDPKTEEPYFYSLTEFNRVYSICATLSDRTIYCKSGFRKLPSTNTNAGAS